MSAPSMLIGIAGFQRSGKDTFANFLCENHGYVAYSFAEPIRKMVTQMCRAVDHDFDLERDKEMKLPWAGGKTPRDIMRAIGTEGVRQAVHPSTWVDLLMLRVQRARDSGIDCVISDVRFANEAVAIRAVGGVVLWMHRPGCEPANHASEQGIPAHLVDFTIHNDSDLYQFRKGVASMENSIRVWKRLQYPLDGERVAD